MNLEAPSLHIYLLLLPNHRNEVKKMGFFFTKKMDFFFAEKMGGETEKINK